MRARANFRRKPPDDPDPYWRDVQTSNLSMTEGDLNRMERDYLHPVYPEPPWASREPKSDPTARAAAALDIDETTVRRVLRYVFLEQL